MHLKNSNNQTAFLTMLLGVHWWEQHIFYPYPYSIFITALIDIITIKYLVFICKFLNQPSNIQPRNPMKLKVK